MTMALPSGDVRAAALNTNVTNAQTAYNAAVNGSADQAQKFVALTNAQMALVQYYLASGRLQPSLNLASTL